jgi:hypothetical protein
MDAPEVVIDFKPTFTVERLVQKMESARRDFFKEAQLRWKLSKGACAIVQQLYGEFDSAQALAEVVKSCRIALSGPRPLDEVISTSGGCRMERAQRQADAQTTARSLLRRRNDRLGGTHRRFPDAGLFRHRQCRRPRSCKHPITIGCRDARAFCMFFGKYEN